MDLSPATIEHLRDEAYTLLCQEAIRDEIEHLERQKEDLIDSRPSFAGPDGAVSCQSRAHTMLAAMESGTRLRCRLPQLAQIQQQLQRLLLPELSRYLEASSPEYGHVAFIQHQLDRWENLFHALQGKLGAFAAAVRQVLEEAISGRGGRDLELFVALRDSAVRLEQHLAQLDEIGRLLAANTVPGSGICLPTLPDFRRVGWVHQIFPLPAPQLAAETARVEAEIRRFVSSDHHEIFGLIRDSRDVCHRSAEGLLQHYWGQLRVHAQIYYVKEREIDDVIKELIRCYARPPAPSAAFTGTAGAARPAVSALPSSARP